MKTSVSPLKLIVCTAGISFSLLVPQLTWAQTTTTTTNSNNALDDLNSQQNTNPFSSRSDTGDAMSGIMDLMHRAQMGNIRSTSEYSADQNRSLNDAAAQFRQKQLQMLRNQNQNQTNPAQAPQVAK